MDTKLIKSYLDIVDLPNSAKMLALVNEIVELNIKLNAMQSLVLTKFDSRAFEAACEYERNKPVNKEMIRTLQECCVSLKTAEENPQARLQAMMKAKLEGRL